MPILIRTVLFLPILHLSSMAQAGPGVDFVHLSSAEEACSDADKRLPCPTLAGIEQTSTLILDINIDGKNDFVIANRSASPSVVWFERTGTGWRRHVIEDKALKIEAGGDGHDMDGDGDPDIVLGGDHTSHQVWWWENPAPHFKTPWIRRVIKDEGSNKHHDLQFGDFDGDGKAELAFWNQKGKTLFLAEVPTHPKTSGPWPKKVVFKAPDRNFEGLSQADVDGDGTVDIIAAGRWFKHLGEGGFQTEIIDEAMAFTRAAAGQLMDGGRPEVVFVCGDCDGPLKMYQYQEGRWLATTLIEHVVHGHSLQLADLNGDGNLDVFVAEMRLNGGNPEARIRILYGDGQGHFQTQELGRGLDNHESKVADLDGDGDLDILSKPYNWQTPRLDIWLNQGKAGLPLPLNQWRRHLIGHLGDHGTHVVYGDFDQDGDIDLAAANSWFQNPGAFNRPWKKHPIGEPMRNVAMVRDFNGDGRMDLFGTAGVGAKANHTLVWAENTGAGFKIHTHIETGGYGDYLQGIGFLNATQQVILSWHNGGGGVQAVGVPAQPERQVWPLVTLSSATQNEDLSVGDMDGDGNEDILQGSQYLKNNGTTFELTAIGTVSDLELKTTPDRNDWADINGDGKLDAVVALEKGRHLLWFEQNSPSQWHRHIITSELTGQGFSMDVADFDQDGDPDVVVGEHRGRPNNRVLIFENQDRGQIWKPWLVDTGPAEEIDHHDGTQAVDIDHDGDQDLISIGWYNKKLWVFENRAR